MHNSNQSQIKFSLLRLSQVKEYTGLSRSTIYAAIKESRFPSPVKVGRRAIAWRSTDVELWINTRTLSNQANGA